MSELFKLTLRLLDAEIAKLTEKIEELRGVSSEQE